MVISTIEGNTPLQTVTDSIIRKENSVLMYHSGKRKTAHVADAMEYRQRCKDSEVDCCSIIHNGDGFTVKGTKKGSKLLVNFKLNKSHRVRLGKKMYTFKPKVPTDVITFYAREYKHIGIFGNLCMNMGNTYNDTSKGVFITDLVVPEVCNWRENNEKASNIIQQIGRAFRNDSNQVPPVLWFRSQNQLEQTDRFFRAEDTCQIECQETSFKEAVPNEIIRKARTRAVPAAAPESVPEIDGRVHRSGNVYQQSDDGLEERFQVWSNPVTNTMISKLMKRLEPLRVYTRAEFLELAVSCGIKDTNKLINDMTTVSVHTYGRILDVNGDRVRLRPELVEMYNRYFQS